MKNKKNPIRKKVNKVFVVIGMMIFLACGSIQAVSAAVPYSNIWGFLYREPEYQNQFGRVWYQACGTSQNKYLYNIYLECYHNCGSYTRITTKVVKNGKIIEKSVEDSQATRGYSSCILRTEAGETSKSARVFGSGYGVYVDKQI